MKKIALIYGGDSSEWGISVLSGKFVASCLDKDKYAVTELLLRGGQWSVCDPEVKDVAVPVKNSGDLGAARAAAMSECVRLAVEKLAAELHK